MMMTATKEKDNIIDDIWGFFKLIFYRKMP